MAHAQLVLDGSRARIEAAIRWPANIAVASHSHRTPPLLFCYAMYACMHGDMYNVGGGEGGERDKQKNRTARALRISYVLNTINPHNYVYTLLLQHTYSIYRG